MESKNKSLFLFGRTRALAICAALGAVATSHAVILSDDTFTDSGWASATYTRDNGGAMIASQSWTMGNPGASREILHLVEGGPSLLANAHVFNGGPFTNVTGVASVNIKFDFYHGNDDVTYGFVLNQNGQNYVTALTTRTGAEWTTLTSGTLVAADFFQLQANGNLTNSINPDFSASGGDIRFGFFTANSQSINGGWYSRTIYVDNFHVEVLEAVPEPASMAALGLGIAALLRRRAAKK